MSDYFNELGQPVGAPVPNWQPNEWPREEIKDGRFCLVVPLDIDTHGEDLFAAYSHDKEGRNWTYLPYGPFDRFEGFVTWLKDVSANNDPMFHTIIDKLSGKAVGVATYLRISPETSSIEVGHIHFSPLLQRTPHATEAMFMMMRHVFDDLNYRRYEWKCNAANVASCNAALRFGFTAESVFRQAGVVKGYNRDTAWFSIIDSEWAEIKKTYERWLSPDNFDAEGQQRKSLSEISSY